MPFNFSSLSPVGNLLLEESFVFEVKVKTRLNHGGISLTSWMAPVEFRDEHVGRFFFYSSNPVQGRD